jgi:hypothetical protein
MSPQSESASQAIGAVLPGAMASRCSSQAPRAGLKMLRGGIVRRRQKMEFDNPERGEHLWRCLSNAMDELRRTSPSVSTRLLVLVGVGLLLIGLEWLIVWGCVAVVRWVRQGFVAP